MIFRSLCYTLVVLGIFLILETHCRTSQPIDSFDESFEESNNFSPEVQKAVQPAEDVFLGFINRLINTGYASSKITLNRIEKASQKRREFSNQLQDILAKLPNYNSKIPVVDDVPRIFLNPN